MPSSDFPARCERSAGNSPQGQSSHEKELKIRATKILPKVRIASEFKHPNSENNLKIQIIQK